MFPSSNEIWQLAMIAVNGVFLICAHASVVAANDGTTLEGGVDLINRLWGDQPLQIMDFVFLGCAVILGLEILNRLVANSGCKYKLKFIYVSNFHPLSLFFTCIINAQINQPTPRGQFFASHHFIDRPPEYETYSCEGKTFG